MFRDMTNASVLSEKKIPLITVEKIWKSIRSPKWLAMLLFLSRIRETSLNLELFTFVKIRKIVKKMISWAAGTRGLPFLGFGGLEFDCRTFQHRAFFNPKIQAQTFNPRLFYHKLGAKLYIPSMYIMKTESYTFLFPGRLDHQGSTENFCNLMVFSYYFNGWNKYKITLSVHCKKIINITVNFGHKC